MVDYEQLLTKYIDYISTYEGTDFISGYMGSGFTEEETIRLMELSQQVEDSYKASIGINT